MQIFLSKMRCRSIRAEKQNLGFACLKSFSMEILVVDFVTTYQKIQYWLHFYCANDLPLHFLCQRVRKKSLIATSWTLFLKLQANNNKFQPLRDDRSKYFSRRSVKKARSVGAKGTLEHKERQSARTVASQGALKR